MKDGRIRLVLAELATLLGHVPELEREKFLRWAEESAAQHETLDKVNGELQGTLDHLRLSIKYLVFDLEATRRENQYLRRILEEAANE